MAQTVHNGYTPDELESFEKHEKRNAALILGLMLALIVTAYVPMFYYGAPLSDTAPAIVSDVVGATVIGLAILIVVLFIVTMPKIEFRDKICKSLAGLELGVFHCSDDLVIIVGLSRECADMVIDGQYDNWLRSRKVCKLIG